MKGLGALSYIVVILSNNFDASVEVADGCYVAVLASFRSCRGGADRMGAATTKESPNQQIISRIQSPVSLQTSPTRLSLC